MTLETAFTHFPTLTTARLRLRQIETSDAEALYAIKSDLEVTRRYAQEPHPSSRATLGWIERLQDGYTQRAVLFWAVTLKEDDQVIGACTFWNFGPDFTYVELGYELHQAYWRQGIMAEALKAVLTCGFNDLGLHRVEAVPLAVNEPSRQLLLKLGFKYEGNLRQREFFRGKFEDQQYFGLLKDEWAQSV
jgi:ribosomal-protein-alanine N-acetyltransferase